MQLGFSAEFFSSDGRPLKLAFVIDPLDSRRPFSDPGVAFMASAERHGHEVFAIESATLGWRRPEPGHPGGVFGLAQHVHVRPEQVEWYRETGRSWLPLREFDAVILRKDGPLDLEYLHITWLLDRAEADGIRVFNRPRAVRDHAEKQSLIEFAQFLPSTVISRDLGRLQEFIDEQRDVIVKSLDTLGHSQVFRIHRNDPNRNVILETLTADGQRSIMAQHYLPEVTQGDKRIILIGGKPVPYCLARIPPAGETRSSLEVGGTGIAHELSAHDRHLAETLGPVLLRRGLLLAGLDVIGQHLTGIDVINPARGLVEIRQQTAFDGTGAFLTAIEQLCG